MAEGRPDDWDPPRDSADELLARHPEWGASLYDRHADGSGTVYSSWRRPITSLRPSYRNWLVDGGRHLAADLELIDWLDRTGIDHDVLTDHDLDRDAAALHGYDVVLTGSHPEYATGRMLDALEEVAASGHHLLYLGGNGFYWVTSVDPSRPHVIEVRRGLAGTRPWTSEPGEETHATTGERGGLWRHRGRPPNRLTGIGFTGQGWDGRSTGYRRTERSYDPDVGFLFDGVSSEVVGDHGLVMGGAAGDELDRYDPSIGELPGTVVLASSTGHSEAYRLVVEDLQESDPQAVGPSDARIRADLILARHPSGGSVFSVGSICWIGGLGWNDGDNDVARITGNMIRWALSG
jgi:N,N-dimethylformamidase